MRERLRNIIFCAVLIISTSSIKKSWAIDLSYLDPDFGTEGYTMLDPFEADGYYDNPIKTARNPDGKIVIGGYSAYSNYDSTTRKTTYIYHPEVVRFNIDGSIDTTFNGTGYSFGTTVGNFYTEEVHVTGEESSSGIPAGTIYLAGARFYDDLTKSDEFDSALVRFNPDGSFDTTFANGTGIFTLDFALGYRDDIYDMDTDSDGNVYAIILAYTSAFSWYDAESKKNWEYKLIKINSDGSEYTILDNTVDFNTTEGYPEISGIKVHDNRLVVWGDSVDSTGHARAAVALYNLDGTLDATFGEGGMAWGDQAQSVKGTVGYIDPNTDRIYLAGSNDVNTITIHCWTSIGQACDDFGTNGTITSNEGGTHPSGITLDSWERLVIVSTVAGGEEMWSYIVRFSAEGTIDTTFGNEGVISDIETNYLSYFSVGTIWTDAKGAIFTGTTVLGYPGAIKIAGDGGPEITTDGQGTVQCIEKNGEVVSLDDADISIETLWGIWEGTITTIDGMDVVYENGEVVAIGVCSTDSVPASLVFKGSSGIGCSLTPDNKSASPLFLMIFVLMTVGLSRRIFSGYKIDLSEELTSVLNNKDIQTEDRKIIF